MGKEYVCNGAKCMCDKGAAPSDLIVIPIRIKLQDKLIATESDKLFMPFGACAMLQGAPCVPALLMWDTDKIAFKTNGGKAIFSDATIKCSLGGTVRIIDNKQRRKLGTPSSIPQNGQSASGLCPFLF